MIETLKINYIDSRNVGYGVWDNSAPPKLLDHETADEGFKEPKAWPINAVTTGGAGSGAFRVAGDQTSYLVVGKKIRVNGSTGNDGVYTIRSGSSFGGGNTTVNVDEAVSDSTADGTLYLVATAALAADEYDEPGGVEESYYFADLDLSLVNAAATEDEFLVVAYERVADIFWPPDDMRIGSNELRVINSRVAAGYVNAAALHTDLDVYDAVIDYDQDAAAAKDEYTVRWRKNGVRITSGITGPTINVKKRVDGSDLIASTAMTQIGSTGAYKYDASGAERLGLGEAALVLLGATIDGATRTADAVVSRDA